MANMLKAFISGLSPKEKKILYIAGGLVCLALFDRLVVGPISRESNLLEERIDSQTKLIEKNLMILQYKDKIIGEDELHGDFYANLDSTQDQRTAFFLSEVEKLAKSSNVALTNINPVYSELKKGFIRSTLSIECSGKMEALTDFIYSIEDSQKPMRVASFEISPKNRDDYEAKCALTVEKIIIMPDGSVPEIAVEEEISEEEME